MHLGLPFWAFDGWQGGLYTSDSRAGDFLRQYGRAFNAVEGNTTFYAVPSERTVEKWDQESPDGFRFCFKMPRTITHDAMLLDVADEAHAFLERISPLRDGPGDHPDIQAARHKKPNLPVREDLLSEDPIVRIVFHPIPDTNERWLDRWAMLLAHWIREGNSPLVFVHSPSNRESPTIARDLLARIDRIETVGSMPAWPGEEGESASGQLTLL